MTFREMEKAKTVGSVLKEAGFTVSQRCCSRPSCFDFAARRNGTLVLVKVQSNAEKVLQDEYLELRVISERVSAASILISEKSRENPLEDDTVYSRYKVVAVTHKTFENMVLHKSFPLIQAGPGGYYVEIDGKAIKRRRLELGLSIGELAEMMSISRRTLYGYERGMAKASVSVAYNMVYTLGIPVAKPFNVFEESEGQPKCFLATAKHAITRNRLLRKIFKKLSRYNITAVKKAPFDFLINIKEEEAKILGGVASNEEQELHRRVDEIVSVSRVIQAYPILITEKQKPVNKDILCIKSEELSKIKNPEDLLANFK